MSGRCACGYKLPAVRILHATKTAAAGAAFRAVIGEHDVQETLVVICPDCGTEWRQDSKLEANLIPRCAS